MAQPPVVDRNAFLNELRNAKAQQLEQTTALKRAQMEQLSSINPPRNNYVAELPQDTLNRYESIQDYVREGNTASLEVIDYFDRRNLREALQGVEQRQKAKQEREATAWASDHDLDTFVGKLKQRAAAVVTGVAHTAGETAAAPFSVGATTDLVGVDNRARELYGREVANQRKAKALDTAQADIEVRRLAGEISPLQADAERAMLERTRSELPLLNQEEQAYLDRMAPPSGFQPGYLPPTDPTGNFLAVPVENTVREKLARSEQGFRIADEINKAFNENDYIKGIKNPKNAEKVSQELHATWDKHAQHFTDAGKAWEAGNKVAAIGSAAKGLLKVAKDGGIDLSNNPEAVFEVMLENTPQLVLGAFSKTGLAATNIAYGQRIFTDSILDYQAKNNGALPSQEEAAKRLAISLSAAVAEELGDVSILKAMGVGKTTTKTFAEAAEIGSKSIIKRGAAGLARTAAEGGKSVFTESATELYQQTVEDNLSKGNTDFDGGDLFEAAALGGAAGGGFGAGGRLVNELKEGRINNGAAYLKKLEKRQAEQKALAAAKKTGDVSGLMNKKSENYSPEKAIEALIQHTAAEDTAPEVREENLKKVGEIVSAVEAEYATARDFYRMSSPEGIAETKQEIEQLSTELEQIADDPAQAERAGLLQKSIALLQEDVAAAEQVSERQLAKREKAFKEAEQRLAAVKTRQKQMAKLFEKEAEDLTEAVELADSTPDVADTAAVEAAQEATSRIVSMAMNMPEEVPTDVLDRLAGNEFNTLTPDQRDYLRALSESRTAEGAASALGDITHEILNGDPETRSRGLRQYQDSFAASMRHNVPAELIRRQLGDLRRFAKRHASKAAVITQAFNKVEGTGKKLYIAPENNVWSEIPAPAQGEKLPAGAMYVAGNSGNLVEATNLEAQALNAAHRAMAAAYKLKFSAPQQETTQDTEPAHSEVRTQVRTEEQTQQEVEDSEASVAESPAIAEATVATPAEEAVTEETNEETDTTTTDDGKLSVFARNPEPVVDWDASIFVGANLIAQFFTQIPGKETDGSRKPLASVTDFASKLAKGEVSLKDFLSKGEITEDQQIVIDAFLNFASKLSPIIDEVLPKTRKHKAFQHENLVDALMDEDGKLDENVKTAIALAGFNYVVEKANSPMNTDSEINAMLGRPKTHYVGTRDRIAINSMGRTVVQALGLKALPHSPVNMTSLLETAMGSLAMAALVDMGMLERHQIPTEVMDEMAAMTPGEQKAAEVDKHTKHHFLRIPRVDGKNIPAVHNLLSMVRGSQGIVGKLFDTEDGLREPSLEPVAFTQKKAQRTNQDVPEEAKKLLDKEGKKASRLRNDMWAVYDNLSTFAQEAMAGITDRDRRLHKVNAFRQQAKDDSLRRQLEHLDTYGLKFLDKAVYFARSFWKPQRVGLSSNTINPQTSKIHRAMFAMDGWEVTVKLDDRKMLDTFKLVVASGLGIALDKQSHAKSLKQYHALMENPTMTAAVNALRERIYRDTSFTEEDEKTLVQAVKKGGMDFHSLGALVAQAHYVEALATGASSFKTDLMGEIDGVTNGPMLSLLMLGAADFNTLNRGGFFEVGSPHENHNLWKEDSANYDLYQHTTAKMLGEIRKSFRDTPALRPVFHAVTQLTGNLFEGTKITSAGRNLVKTPLTAMMFGSSTRNAVEGMAEEFVDKYYAKLEDIANGAPIEQLLPLIQNVNTILRAGGAGKYLLNERMTIDQAMDTALSKRQVSAMKEVFNDVIGSSVKTVLEENFAVFLKRRTLFNRAAQTSFNLYKAAYDALREAKLNELAEEGKAATRKERSKTKKNQQKAIHDLTQQQEAEIRAQIAHLLPQMATALSRGDMQSGLYMGNVTLENASTSDPGYTVSAKFGKKLPITGPDGSQAEFSSIQTSGTIRGETNPGVATLILAIHSTDSAIAMRAYSQLMALNIHDALGIGIDSMTQAGQYLNSATYHTMLNYSAPSAVADGLNRVVEGVAALLDSDTLSESTKELLRQNLAQVEVKSPSLTKFVQNVKFMAFSADRAKLERLANTNVVNQYSYQGGGYRVTDVDRKQAKDKKNSLSPVAPASVIQAANRLSEFVQSQKEESTEKQRPATVDQIIAVDQVANDTTQPQEVQDAAQQMLNAMLEKKASLVDTAAAQENRDTAARVVEQAAQRKGNHPLGQLGNPRIPADAALVNFLQQQEGGVVKAIDFMRALNNRLTKQLERRPDDAMLKYQQRLVRQLALLVNKDLNIQYVTPDTDPALVTGENIDKARGWYDIRPTGNKIFVRSPDFVHSGLTVDLMLHELLHAALADVIHAALNNPKHPAHALVQELEVLRLQAVEFLVQNPELSAKYSNAVDNIDELVSWGMTHRGFQQEVMNKIRLPESSKTKRRKLVTMMQEFIGVLTDLIFRDKPLKVRDKHYNGMSVLIANTSGLFAAAAQRNEQASTRTYPQQSVEDELTTEQLFDEIGKASSHMAPPSNVDQLRALLSRLVDTIHGPYGFYRAEAKRNAASTPVDRFVNALIDAEKPFVSEVLAAEFKLAPQTAFVLEQVEAVIGYASDNSSTLVSRYAITKELARIHKEAGQRLTPKDFHEAFTGTPWSTATQAEKDTAERQHRFVFTLTQEADKRSATIGRFAAMALTMPEFSSMLNYTTKPVEARFADMTWMERLRFLFEQALAILGGSIAAGYGERRADVKLQSLIEKLVRVEKRRSDALKRRDDSVLSKLEDGVAVLRDKLMGAALTAAKSPKVRDSGNAAVRALGGVVATVASDRVTQLLDAGQQVRDKIMKEKPGVIMGLVNEARSLDKQAYSLLLQMKDIEHKRKATKDGTAQLLLESFSPDANITREVENSITQVLLRTDAALLLDHFSLADIETMLSSEKALDTQIQAWSQKLNGSQHQEFYLRQSMDLGYFLATDLVRNTHLLLNAGNIARRQGIPGVAVTQKEVQRVQPIIDVLTTLYGLKYTNQTAKDQISDLMRVEAQREDGGNGVEFVLRLHKQLQQQSRERLFSDDELHMMKGYTPQLYNEGVEIVVADEQDGAELVAQGWVQGPRVRQDKVDPDQRSLHIYKLADRGLQSYNSGVVSFTGTNTRGAKKHSSLINPVTGATHIPNTRAHRRLLARKRQGIAELDTLPTNYQPDRGDRRNYLVPVFDNQGNIVNYRYLMSASLKDSLLERDNRFSTVLGSLHGNIFDKEHSAVHNRTVVESLHEQFLAEYAKSPDSFLEISPNSDDPKLRELWYMLPKQMQNDVKDVFGKPHVMVRTDLLYPVFGYRKLAAANMLDKDYKPQNIAEKVFTALPKLLWGDKAGLRVNQIGTLWQDIVANTKDILVIKTGSTLFWNVVSNTSQLLWAGVSPVDIVRHGRIALAGAIEHRAASKELHRLKTMRDSGYIIGNSNELGQRIIELENVMVSNPVHELIEAGLLPTIVEDVAMEDALNGRESLLDKKLKPFIEAIPAPVRKVGGYVVMAHDTPLYQVLYQSTQLSDFVARYTMYQNLISRRRNPLSKQDAIIKVSDMFVNYDIPSHPLMQYLNDMGFLYFTKYYIRIQRIILGQWLENPVRGLLLKMGDDYFTSMQTIMDSTVHLGNPIEPGAFKMLEAADEGIMAKLFTGVIK